MAAPSITLLFGFEVEAIFNFHEDMLKDYLYKRHNRAIQLMKDTTAHEVSFRHRAYPRKPYRSWALGGLNEHDETHDPYLEDADSKVKFRAYLDEPIHMVQELLSSIPGRENLATHHLQSSKQTAYGNWSISNDFSLSGVQKHVMMEHLSDRISCVAEANNWDSWGVELISPPYSQIAQAMADASVIVTKMIDPTSTKHGAFVNTSCGFHVHVGQPDNQPFTLETLQNLAWLLITFEEAISGLHSPHRRQIFGPNEDGSRCEILSNRETWLLDEPIGPVPRLVRDPIPGEVSTKNFDQQYRDLVEIKMDIFDLKGEPEASQLQKLVKIMNPYGRAHVVNLKGLVTPGRPLTVEFRQHAGTLDTEEMRWWIEFCTGLVRLAHKRATAGGVPMVERWEEVVDLGVCPLLEEMEFPEEGIQFYRKKMMRYPPEPCSGVFSERYDEEDEDDKVKGEGEEGEDGEDSYGW